MVEPLGDPLVERRRPILDNAIALGLPKLLPQSTVNPNGYRYSVADSASFWAADIAGRHVVPSLPRCEAEVGNVFDGRL